MNIQRYRRGPVSGYQVVEGRNVKDAASDKYLDFLNEALNRGAIRPELPETLMAMCERRWMDAL